MNFLAVHYKDGRINDGKGLDIAIPEGRANILNDRGYNDKDVTLGIRPEDIHTEQAFLDTWPDQCVDSVVTVSELMGATSQLYATVDGTDFVATVDARDFHNPGEKVKMGFDVNKAHFFDKETTNAIVTKEAEDAMNAEQAKA